MVGRGQRFGAAAAARRGVSLTDAVVRLPGTASMLDVARLSRRRGPERAFRTCWRGMSRRCSHKPSNPPPAMRRTRSKRACRAGCCMRAICPQRKPAADAGSPGADDRCATQRGVDGRQCAAEGRDSSLQPGSHRNPRRGRAARDILRMLPGGQGAARALAEGDRLISRPTDRRPGSAPITFKRAISMPEVL